MDIEKYSNLKCFTALLGSYENSLSTTAPGTGIIARTETPFIGNEGTPESKSAKSIIKQKQAERIRGSSHILANRNTLAVDLGKYLRRDDTDAVGGAIIKVPAMELESPDEKEGSSAAGLMPIVGRSHHDLNVPPPAASDVQTMTSITSHGTNPKPKMAASLLHMVAGDPKPKMAASLLHMMAEDPKPKMAASMLHMVTEDPKPIHAPQTLCASSSTQQVEAKASSPSTGTKVSGLSSNPTKENVASMISSSSSDTTNLEMAAAVHMDRPLSFTRSSAQHAPSALIRSLYSSFSQLVASRMKTWTLLLLRHSLSSGNKASRERLMALLGSQHSFKMDAIVTEFKVGGNSTPDEIARLLNDGASRKEKRNALMNEGKNMEMDSCDLILPLQFKSVIDMTIQGKSCTVHLDTSGSVGGKFHRIQ